MKLFSAICASALALAGAGTAQATTYSPAGTYVFQGTVDVNKGIALTCTLKITVVATSSSATATPVLSGGSLGLCSTVTFSATPYAVTFDGTNLILNGVVVNTITPGGCSGNIGAVWDGVSTPRKLTVNASLPGGGGSAPCTIVSKPTLNQISGPAGLTITNP